jgi:PEGA domain-containing protein
METNAARAQEPRQALFKDGLGTRYRRDGSDGPLDVLILRDTFASIPSFEFLIRERINRLAHVRSDSFARVLDLEHVPDGAKLAIVSKAVPGVRLSKMLSVAEQNLIPLDVDSALYFIQQLLAAMAELHGDAPDACHGTLAAERVVVTPDGNLVVVEHVLGAALGQLRHSPERYWKELRIALPTAVAAPLLDRRADVAQVGMIALALLLGRPITDDEYPEKLTSLVNGTYGLGGSFESIPEWLRGWLSQALSLEPTRWFASCVEAREAFEVGLKAAGLAPTAEKLDAFPREYGLVEPSRPAATTGPTPVTTSPASATPAPVQQKPTSTPAANTPAPAPLAVQEPKPVNQKPIPVSPSPASRPVEPTPAAASVFPSEQSRPAAIALKSSRDEESETETSGPSWNPRAVSNHRPRMIAAAVVVVALTSGGVLAARRYFSSPAETVPTTGTVAVNTDPAGAAVVIDGQAHGTTPATATLKAGPHTIELSKDGVRRTMTVNVTANQQLSQFIEMPKPTAGTGDLQVRTDPPGARVVVDGQVRGSSPVSVQGLAPGNHVVVLQNDLGSVNEDVTIQAGATASLVVPLKTPQGAPVSGWISITAPAELQVLESDRLLGTSRTDRIMVAAGRHEIEIVNETLGYRTTQSIQVAPGQVARLKPDWPMGTIAINATPWANVTLDGKDLGETPVGNTSVPVGTHEVVFKHPQLGEQRFTTTVTANTPARLSVDMRKK